MSKAGPKHGERVTLPDRRKGTVIDTHTGGAEPKVGVLLDTGPRTLVLVPIEGATFTAPVRDCRRCGARDHAAPACRKD